MTAFVVDASVALKWFVEEEGSADAVRILPRASAIHAPRLLHAEIGNALWSNVRRGTVSIDQARRALDSLGRTVTRWHDDPELIDQAFEWSVLFDHPIYDFCYLALASRLGLQLVTADRRFSDRLKGSAQASLILSMMEVP